MDQEKAKVLFKEGGFLIIEGMPEGNEFGIDWKIWTTGPRFQGIKMIPPGVHFISYNAVSVADGGKSPKTGFFHDFQKSEILVKKWNPETEEIESKTIGSEELQHLKLNLQNLDQNLGAYPYDTYRKWVSMSSAITPQVINKLAPINVNITSGQNLISTAGTSEDHKFGKVDDKGLPVMERNPDALIRFTKIPEHWYPEGCSSQERSRHSMDSSFVLNALIAECDILGELQYAFVCFILGQVLDGFDHWRQLVKILCNCEKDLVKHREIYVKLIAIMYHQLGEISPDFFVDIVSSNNFLVTHLTTLFENICNCEYNDDDELKKISLKFRKHLTKKYRWKFNEEPADWAPVVVEL